MTEVVGVDVSELEDAIRAYGRKAGSMRAVTRVISEELVSLVSDVFEAEGPGWDPLEDSTLARRRGGGKGAKILQDTGVFAGSVSPGSGDDWAEAFSGVSYGIFHVTGTENMPRRDPFDFGPFESDALRSIADMLLEHVTSP